MPKEQVRTLAAAAWLAGGRNVSRAFPFFKESMQQAGLTVTAAAKKLIEKWGRQLEEKGHVRAAHHKAGRKSKLSSKQVATLVDELLGWRQAGLTAPYPSIRRFCLDNPIAKKIKAKAGVCTETIRRQLQLQALASSSSLNLIWTTPSSMRFNGKQPISLHADANIMGSAGPCTQSLQAALTERAIECSYATILCSRYKASRHAALD